MSENMRYGTNSSNTSKFMQDLLNEFIKMPKGVFNLNRRKIQDVSPYAITPIESWEMLPNSDVYLKYDISMLSKNPTVKRLLSGMTAELRVYKVNYNDCWEGWNNFITKGRSGKVTKEIPYVDLSLGSNDVTTSLPYNPMECMRHAPTVFLATGGTGDINKFTFDYNVGVKAVSSLQSSGKTGISTLAGLKASTAMRINALPYVAYNKIVKEYQNSNLLQNNPHWYPENENHDQILPYSATGAVTTSDYDNPTQAFVTGTSRELISAVNDGTDDNPVYNSYPWLNVLQYSQRKGDYFNTGSPFPDLIRGDIPTLQVLNASINWDNVIGTADGSNYGTNKLYVALNGYQPSGSTDWDFKLNVSTSANNSNTNFNTAANAQNFTYPNPGPTSKDSYLKTALSKATVSKCKTFFENCHSHKITPTSCTEFYT